MRIVGANPLHIDYISDLLSQHFSEANRFFGYPKYKDSFELMKKHVSKRIELLDESFVYFVAEDDNNKPIGFINLLLDENNVGNILITVANNNEIAKELILYVVKYFKDRGVNNIQGEIFEYEKDLKGIYSEIGIKNELLSFRLSI